MLLLIDGYNLLHSKRVLPPLPAHQLQAERERLIDQLSRYRQAKSLEILVVFDGWQGGWSTERRERRKGIEIIFSKEGEKADEVIKRIIRAKGSAVVVVTSDREIGTYANRRSVAVVTSEQFRDRLEGGQPWGERIEGKEGEGKKRGPSQKPSKRERRLSLALRKL